MVKILNIYFLSIFFLIYSCTPLLRNKLYEEKSKIHTYDREYHPNRSLKYETMYKNGVLDGHVKSWDKGGKLISKVEYISGVLHGSWETYYASGQLKHSALYQNGKKNGIEVWYHENGIKQSEVMYVDDIVQSETIRWDKEGRRIFE